MVDGYRLSSRAAANENKWRAERVGPGKGIVVSGFVGDAAMANRNDFETNRVSIQAYTDVSPRNNGSASALSAAGACVAFWSGNIAGLPLHVLRKGPNGVDTAAPDHPLYWLLHDSPNYDQSAFDFWEYMVDALEWHGNAYATINRTGDGRLASFTPIDPTIVRAKRRPDGEIEYRWSADGRNSILASRGMLHIRGRGGDALGGLSTLSVYRRAFTSAQATEASASTIFENGVRSSGVLETANRLDKEQRDTLENLLQNRFQGAQNAGRPMLLDNGLKWTPLSISPVDAEMIESRRLSMEIICQIFEVDPHLVGITSGNTKLGSSIGDQTLSLVKFKMHKRLKRIEGALEKQLLTPGDRRNGISIKFNLEGFLRADSLGRAKYYDLMKQFMTVNEVRALEGLPPVPGGDVIYRQMQDQPLSGRGIGDNGGPPLENHNE